MTNQTIRLMACILLMLPLAFTACVKDTCSEYNTYTWYEPVYKPKTEVRSNIKSNAPKTIANAGKLCILGNYIFLNDIDKGIHVIDNSNPASPKNIAFIDIPGNLDIAVKGNTLYADMYSDLVTIDISNPKSVQPVKFIDNTFPYRSYGNGFNNSNSGVIVDWIRHDTTTKIDCGSNRPYWLDDGRFFSAFANAAPGAASQSPIGKGGSMARFTIIDNRLYTVSMTDLDVFNIANANDPSHTKRVNIGWNIETIYPFQSRLFVGSQSGMFIYDVTNPDLPVQQGQFAHVRVCDPVIADNDNAYVTLRSGSTCQGFTNELNVLKLNGTLNPTLLKVYKLTNPHGLSKDGKLLFICDGADGLKVFDATDAMNVSMIRQVTGPDTYDVIAYNNVALVVAKDGLYQYKYNSAGDMQLLSKINTGK